MLHASLAQDKLSCATPQKCLLLLQHVPFSQHHMLTELSLLAGALPANCRQDLTHMSLLLSSMQIGTQVYDVVHPILAPHADRALRSADEMIKNVTGVDTGLSTVPQRFWA